MKTLVRQLTSEEERILGKLLVEGLSGEITEQTREELNKLSNLPEPYRHIVSSIGRDADGKQLADLLVDELRIIGMERIDAKMNEPHPLGVDWIMMYNILEVILGESDRDLQEEANLHAEAGTTLANMERIPMWAKLLVKHIHNCGKGGKQLTLQLLALMEQIIRKRKRELEGAPE